MIEEVEGFRSELQVHTFRQHRILHQRRIEALKSRSFQNIPACIAKRSRSREDESVRVEPLRPLWDLRAQDFRSD